MLLLCAHWFSLIAIHFDLQKLIQHVREIVKVVQIPSDKYCCFPYFSPVEHKENQAGFWACKCLSYGCCCSLLGALYCLICMTTLHEYTRIYQHMKFLTRFPCRA